MFDGEAAAAAEWVNEFEIYINYKLKKIYLWNLCLWHRRNINVVVVIAIAGLMYWMTEYNHENHARIRLWLFINLTKCVYNYIINILSKFHISKTFRFIYDFEFPFFKLKKKDSRNHQTEFYIASGCSAAVGLITIDYVWIWCTYGHVHHTYLLTCVPHFLCESLSPFPFHIHSFADSIASQLVPIQSAFWP